MSDNDVMARIRMDFESGKKSGKQDQKKQEALKPFVPTPDALAKKKENKIQDAAATKAGLNVAFYIDPVMMKNAAGETRQIDFDALRTELSELQDWVIGEREPPIICTDKMPYIDFSTATPQEVQNYWMKYNASIDYAAAAGEGVLPNEKINGIIHRLRKCADMLDENRTILEKIQIYLNSTAEKFMEFEEQAKQRVQGLEL